MCFTDLLNKISHFGATLFPTPCARIFVLIAAVCCSGRLENDADGAEPGEAGEAGEHTPMVELPPALPPRGAPRITALRPAGDKDKDRPLSGEVKLPTRVHYNTRAGLRAQVTCELDWP